METLGAGKFNVGFVYTHAKFDTLNGDNIHRDGTFGLINPEPVGAEVAARSGNRLPGIADDTVEAMVRFAIKFDTFTFAAAYGITDRWDVGIALPLVRVDANASASARVVDNNRDSGGFGALNRLQFDPSRQRGTVDNSQPGATVTDGFPTAVKFGVGDVYLRTKYRAFETPFVDGAGAFTLTLPTGGADDFLGFNDVTATPLLIFSKNFGWISLHLNGGYAFRSERDVGQAIRSGR